MADVPYIFTASTLEDTQRQTWELIRNVYEDRIGGAELGDVFSIQGDVLTLDLGSSTPGLEKSNNRLQVKATSTGGVNVTANGVEVKLDGSTLTVGANGVKVTVVSTGWTVTNKTATKTLDCDTADIAVVADVLGTLIDDLKTAGLLGGA